MVMDGNLLEKSRLRAAIDTATYETGVVISDEELARVDCRPAQFHGEWNYTIKP